MRQIGIEELRQKQMEILDYVADFCDSNDICYTLIGGTLLGAIRHGGYIPWDDDIDIGMLREDYERFSELFPKKCDKSGYVFKSPELDKRWHIPFGKVMDMNTLFVQDGHDLGINIDIFPFDDTPNDPKVTARMYKIRDRLKYISAAQMRKQRPSGNILRRLVVCCVRTVLHCFPDYYFMQRIATRAKKYAGRGYDHFGNFTGENKADPCKKSIMRETITASFEDREYKIPKDYDMWLRIYFGDYMTLPPEEERKRHTYEAYVDDVLCEIPGDAQEQKMPKYSIIIPVYNMEDYLPKCVGSVLEQTTLSEFEVIFVDDGSTDASGSLCDSYSRSDARVRVIHQENKGCSAARNTGMKDARGEYILFLDPDDYWEQELLSVMDELVSRKPDMVMFGVHRVYPDGRRELNRVLAIPQGETGQSYLQKVFQLGGLPRPYVWAYAYRRAFLDDRALAFREDLQYSEDLEFNMRAIPLTESITGTDRVLYNWVIRPNSATQDLSERSILDNLRCMREIYERYPVAAVANNYTWFALTLDKRYSGDLTQISASIEQNPAILKVVSGAAIKLGAILIRFFGYARGRKLLWTAINAKNRLKGILHR